MTSQSSYRKLYVLVFVDDEDDHDTNGQTCIYACLHAIGSTGLQVLSNGDTNDEEMTLCWSKIPLRADTRIPYLVVM